MTLKDPQGNSLWVLLFFYGRAAIIKKIGIYAISACKIV